jgi:diguanylate cyclase (GGDEF)-like protein
MLLTAAATGPAGFLAGWASLRAPLGRARREARTDKLTGLANRAGLEAELMRRAAGRDPWVLVLVDLDGFKQVNDVHGYAAGDTILVEVARRLTAVADRGDVVARLGGDEFVIVASNEVAWTIASHIKLVLRRPMLYARIEVAVTASVGLVQALPGDDPQAVLHSADIALHGAKTNGKDQAVEFNPAAALVDVDPERPRLRWRELAGARLSEVSDGR